MRYIIFILLFLTLATNFTLADGCYVPKIAPGAYAQDITEPTQKAVIVHVRGKERMILQVSFKGKASEFAWLVPTPSKPQIEKCEYAIFNYLHQLTAPRIKYWLNADAAIQHMSRGRSAGIQTNVNVLEQKRVGIYDVAVISAKNETDLIKWLQTNHYNVPSKLAPIAADYIRRGWVFTAARINTAEQKSAAKSLHSGTLESLCFEFRTKKPIYPLKISSLNPGRSKLLLYVLTDHRVTAKGLRTVCVLDTRLPDVAGLHIHYQNYINIQTGDTDSYYYVNRLTELAGDFTSADMTQDLLLHNAPTNKTFTLTAPPPFLDNLKAVSTLFLFPPFSLIILAGCCIIGYSRLGRKHKDTWIAGGILFLFAPLLIVIVGMQVLAFHDEYAAVIEVTALIVAAYVTFRLLRRRKKKASD